MVNIVDENEEGYSFQRRRDLKIKDIATDIKFK
jgi:hypothetical protein